MTRVFSHGGLRLVLLSILEDGPKHGYELILAIEERFMGMYRPSSGTIYPRLAALEEEGLITGRESDGRRIYELTDAGREELARRKAELDETVITATSTVRAVVDELRTQIRDAVASVQADLGEAVADVRRHADGVAETVSAADNATRQAWRASEHARRLAVDEAKRVRRAADELRRVAEREARLAARQARDAARQGVRAATDEIVRAGDEAPGSAQGPAVRDELEAVLADVAGWASEMAEQIRRRIPDETQRARVRDALAHARRAFVETLSEGTDGRQDDSTGSA